VAGTPVDPRSSWTVNKLANTGRHFVNDKDNDRRFFNRPDVVQSFDDSGVFDAVLIGSGDRENPNAEDTTNFFYMIKDRAIKSGVLTDFVTYQPNNGTSADALADLTDNCLQVSSNTCDTTNLTNGWFIQLDDADGGEKNLSPALTFSGQIFFSTFVPGAGTTCGLSEGSGRLFVVNLDDATAVFNFNTSNDSGTVVPTDTYDRSNPNVSPGISSGSVFLGGNNVLTLGQNPSVLNPTGVSEWSTYWYDQGAP